jgi:tRNA A-37 threonylcarbamoyl transferase component Bud32
VSAAADLEPPELPGYLFIRHIGTGGHAKVYLYEQSLPSRRVAVKVLNDSALSEAARRRFTAEANVTAVLAHRHIVQVFDAKVTDDGRPYIVMPFYPQPNLSVRARRAQFSVAEVLRIGIQIGSAVETSHRNGVLHRDIKPQNILTDSYGEPALTDFGIATTTLGDGPEGLSVPWSPPEILHGTGPGDRRSDVYSLGATLWHLLVGRPPFEQPGDNTVQLMQRINAEPPPRTQRADVPDSLERLLRQTMAKNPAARPQTAMELIRGLQSVEQELRLPITQPILPAVEPEEGDARGDTVARPLAHGGEATSGGRPGTLPAEARPATHPAAPVAGSAPMPSTGQLNEPAWELPAEMADTQDATIARGGQPASSRQPVADTPESGQAGEDAAMRGRAGDGKVIRSAGNRQAAPGRSRPGRRLVLAGGGLLAVVAVAAAVLALSHGSGSRPPVAAGTSQAAQQDGGQNALGPGAAAPGQPEVTVRRVSATEVEFSWTYANSAPGDTFRWQESNEGAGAPIQVATKPDVLVAVTAGHSACITVTVRSADGQASEPSDSLCSPS